MSVARRTPLGIPHTPPHLRAPSCCLPLHFLGCLIDSSSTLCTPLLVRLSRSSGGGSSSGSRAGGGKNPAGQQQPVTEQHVSLLLNRGFLTRHTGGPDGYLFSMPAAGAAVRSVAGALRCVAGPPLLCIAGATGLACC